MPWLAPHWGLCLALVAAYVTPAAAMLGQKPGFDTHVHDWVWSGTAEGEDATALARTVFKADGISAMEPLQPKRGLHNASGGLAKRDAVAEMVTVTHEPMEVSPGFGTDDVQAEVDYFAEPFRPQHASNENWLTDPGIHTSGGAEDHDGHTQAKSNIHPVEERKLEQKKKKHEEEAVDEVESDAAPRLEVVENEGRVIGASEDVPKVHHDMESEKKRKGPPSPMEDAGLAYPQEEEQQVNGHDAKFRDIESISIEAVLKPLATSLSESSRNVHMKKAANNSSEVNVKKTAIHPDATHTKVHAKAQTVQRNNLMTHGVADEVRDSYPILQKNASRRAYALDRTGIEADDERVKARSGLFKTPSEEALAAVESVIGKHLMEKQKKSGGVQLEQGIVNSSNEEGVTPLKKVVDEKHKLEKQAKEASHKKSVHCNQLGAIRAAS